MTDQFGRDINYLRLSITDRCNLRCRYCMPDGCDMVEHGDILSYEEFLRLTRLFATLGVEHVRVTGGEPLVRLGAAGFVAELKRVPGVKKVSVTTNGTLLPRYGRELAEAGLDSVNISLDTTDPELERSITGSSGVIGPVMEGMELMLSLGVPVKLNAVLLRETAGTIADLASFAGAGRARSFHRAHAHGRGEKRNRPQPRRSSRHTQSGLAGFASGRRAYRLRPCSLLRERAARRAHRHDRRRVPQVLRELQPRQGDEPRLAQALPLLRRGRGPARAPARRRKR